jgi:tellurite resistance protein
MSKTSKVPKVPASFFGIVLGLVGLGGAWRAAHELWGLPAVVGEALMSLGTLVWAVLMALYVHKWIVQRDDAVAETKQPIQCCFIGLVGVATMLIAGASLPYSRPLALGLFALGGLYTVAFGVWRTGGLWMGGRDPATTTPVLYLPTVAGAFVMATQVSALGYADWGQYAFGAGLLSWLAVESVIWQRLYNAPEMAVPLRPTLGIQLAPPCVGAVAYLSITQGTPNLVAHALLGYAFLQALLLARLFPWIRQPSFAPSYWAVGFGLVALATAPLRMILRGDSGTVTVLAPCTFALANLVVGILAIATLLKLVRGELFPRADLAAPVLHPDGALRDVRRTNQQDQR